MNARISAQYLEDLTTKGRFMVQTLVSNACSMITAAQSRAADDADLCRAELLKQVEQLKRQRQLAGEVVAHELDQSDEQYEAVTLQWFLEDICRRAEVRILTLFTDHAQAAGDEELAATLAALLGEAEETERPLPWVAPAVSAG
jgi:hypothetical protein